MVKQFITEKNVGNSFITFTEEDDLFVVSFFFGHSANYIFSTFDAADEFFMSITEENPYGKM